jgi:hypothetical protein
VSQETTAISEDDIRAVPDRGSSDIHHLPKNPTRRSTPDDDVSRIAISSDLWSKAYREAIDSFGKDIDSSIFTSSTAVQLFKELEEIGKDATQDSVFIRGVAYLRSIQVPLERFKLALDLATPLGSLDPTASTVLGVVKSVTAVSPFFYWTIMYVSEEMYTVATNSTEYSSQLASRLPISSLQSR